MNKLIDNKICLSIISGIVSVICLYINSKIENKKINNINYVKMFLLVTLIVFITHNLVNNSNLKGGGSNILEDIDIDIDDPNF